MTSPDASRRFAEFMRILRFCVVGAAGFVVDAAVLTLMVRVMHSDPFTARAISAPIAIGVTFLLNRYWSFASLNLPSLGRSFVSYVSTQGAGLLCNLAVYSVALLVVPSPVAALAIGSAAAMAINYLGARFWAFQSTS